MCSCTKRRRKRKKIELDEWRALAGRDQQTEIAFLKAWAVLVTSWGSSEVLLQWLWVTQQVQWLTFSTQLPAPAAGLGNHTLRNWGPEKLKLLAECKFHEGRNMFLWCFQHWEPEEPLPCEGKGEAINQGSFWGSGNWALITQHYTLKACIQDTFPSKVDRLSLPKAASITFSCLQPLRDETCYWNPWYSLLIIQCATRIGPRLGLPKFEFGLKQKSQEFGNTSQAGSGKLKERCQKYLGWGYCRNINHPHRLLAAFGLQVRLVSLK